MSSALKGTHKWSSHSLKRRKKHFNPLSPTSDLDRISPYTISMISNRKVMKIKKKYKGDYWLIQFQILQTNIK